MYDIKEYLYDLPKELIAQNPSEDRTDCRLLHIDRATGELSHEKFTDLKKYLRKGDLLVFNNSIVIPARLQGKFYPRDDNVEVILNKELAVGVWNVFLVTPYKHFINTEIRFGDGTKLRCKVIDNDEYGSSTIKFEYEGDFFEALNSVAQVTFPPYIYNKRIKTDRYQTVYGDIPGSTAAPAAGLHFTEEFIDELTEMGIDHTFVTLHVGLGTFGHIDTADVRDYKIHGEYISVSQEAADKINETKKNGGRVICVGTTSCRVIESMANDDGEVMAGQEDTFLFIYPGYQFKVMDGLVTNFHMPGSTLLLLVSAFAGFENIKNAYAEAIKEKYQFLTFGDACLMI